MNVEIEERALSEALQGQMRHVTMWVANIPPSLNITVMVPSTALPPQLAMSQRVEPAIGAELVKLRAQFDALVRQWRQDTDHISSLTKTVMHPSYQSIIGMGRPAVPMILDELKNRGGHWFWALRAITQQNPANGCIEFEAARSAWLEWGKSGGHIR